jgi:hypothetical protein
MTVSAANADEKACKHTERARGLVDNADNGFPGATEALAAATVEALLAIEARLDELGWYLSNLSDR